jgi:hypothetical protein
MKIVNDISKGLVLSMLYFEITKANDLNLHNIIVFTAFYVLLTNGAFIVGIDPNVVTNAFITKSIFVLLDERIKKGKKVNDTPS